MVMRDKDYSDVTIMCGPCTQQLIGNVKWDSLVYRLLANAKVMRLMFTRILKSKVGTVQFTMQ